MRVSSHVLDRSRKWQDAARTVRTHIPSRLPPFFFLTDPERTPKPLEWVERLPEGTGVIYRHFGAADRQEIAGRLSDLCSKQGRDLLISADPALALQIGATGVHWPEKRLREARPWRGRFAVQTASAHSARAIRRAARSGMDAALVSAVFSSESPSAGAPIGPVRFARLAKQAAIPLYGLGGVSPQNVARVSRHAGIAAISGFDG